MCFPQNVSFVHIDHLRVEGKMNVLDVTTAEVDADSKFCFHFSKWCHVFLTRDPVVPTTIMYSPLKIPHLQKRQLLFLMPHTHQRDQFSLLTNFETFDFGNIFRKAQLDGIWSASFRLGTIGFI